VRNVANDPAREFHQTTVGIILRIEQSVESIVDSEDFPTTMARGIDGGVNDRIQPRRVASARVDRNTSNVCHALPSGTIHR
jgi:hypothetical protein